MNIKRAFRSAAILGLSVTAVGYVRADDAATPDQVPAAAAFSTVSVASYEKVNDFAELIGIPLPPQVSPDAIERLLPFIGARKFQTDAPMAIAFLIGKDVDAQHQGVIILPILPGGAPLSAIPNAKKTADADTVVSGGFPFRRTDNFLLFGGTVPITTKFDVGKLCDKYAAAKTGDGQKVTPIFRCDVDMKTLREVDPKKLDAFMVQSMNNGGKPRTEGEAAGSEMMKQWMEKSVDRFDFDVDQVGDNYAASMRVAPMHAQATPVDKPGLPDDCVMRADVRLTEEMIAKLVKLGAGGKAPSDSEKAGTALISMLCLGDAESFGLAPDGDGFVVYDIAQRSGPLDLKAELKKLFEEQKKEHADDSEKTDLAEYQLDDGTTVERIKTVETTGEKRTLYIDSFTRGNRVFTTISLKDSHYVGKLPGLKSAGQFGDVASGWIKPSATIRVITRMSGQPVPPQFHSFDDMFKATDALGDDPVPWHADNDGDGARFTLSIPLDLIKKISTLAAGANN
jgi:hypothetical protein